MRAHIVCRSVLVFLALLTLTECGRQKPSAPVVKDELSLRVERFAGGKRVKVVWCQHASKRRSDPFAITEKLVLMGLDTADGRGVRRLMETVANYSRPMLSPDGELVFYTDKQTNREGEIKSYDPMIHMVDWNGNLPKIFGTGYACDVWRDPGTGVDWVYAVKGLRPSKALLLSGSQLLRYPLKMPGPGVVLMENIDLCPDNVQLSHSGRALSAQMPWPKSGLLKQEGKGFRFLNRSHGCWTSIAPDDSELIWTLDDKHRGLQMVRRDAKEEWLLDISGAEGVGDGEVYHPRWSNHARYITATGPYRLEEADPEKSVINQGGEGAQVLLGRLSKDAKQVEEWLQLTQANAGCAYPDLWIEDGDKAQLDRSLWAQTARDDS